MSGIPKMPSQIQVLSGEQKKQIEREKMKGTEKDCRRKRDGEEIQTKKGLYITGCKAKNNIFLL